MPVYGRLTPTFTSWASAQATVMVSVIARAVIRFIIDRSSLKGSSPDPRPAADSANSRAKPRNGASRATTTVPSGPALSPLGARPDIAVVHEPDLSLNHLVAVLSVLHRRPLEVEILRIDGLLVEELIELGPEVLHPVVPLGPRPVVAECLDVDDASDVGPARAVLLPRADPPR